MGSRRLACRPVACAALVLAVAAIIALAGCGSSGSGKPGPSAAVPTAAVPRLTALARRAARLYGDAHPAWASAVRTTRSKALSLAAPGELVPGSGRTPVYLITIRGTFTAYLSSPPSGARLPTGSYLSLVVLVSSYRVTDLGLTHRPPPARPGSLGPVTYLIGRPPEG